MPREQHRLIIIQIYRTALWLPVIQTVLWLVHGVRDGTFVEWSTMELGPVGDLSGLYTLTILFTALAVVPLIVSISDHTLVRWGTLVFSILFVLASSMDWVGEQSPIPYQIILKVAHGAVALVGVWFAWRWVRAGRANR